MVVVDDEEFRGSRGDRAVPRRTGPGPGRRAGTVSHARRALDLSPEDDHLGRAAASALLGLASWASGDLEAGAPRRTPTAWRGCERAGHVADALGCAIALADIRIAQGRLGEAMRTYEQALAARSRAGRAGAAGDGGHVRRDERAPPRARRPACRHAAPAAQPGAGRARSGCRRTATAGGSRWLGSGRPREIWPARSTCSTRRSACMWVTSPPTCGRSRRGGHGCWVAQGRLGEALGWAREQGLSVDGRPQLPARVRAHHPGQGAPGPAHGRACRGLHRRGDRAPGAPPASGGRGGQDGKRHRDPGAAGARPPDARRHPGCAGVAGTRADAGRAGGLRPGLRGRGRTDGRPAESGREDRGSPGSYVASAPGGR